MKKSVWYTLAQKGSESDDADEVEVLCENAATISRLRGAVCERNKSTLTGVDPRQLEVFEYGENGTKCQGQTNLSECTSGTNEKPFRIFYPGIHIEPSFLEHIIHRTLHATSMIGLRLPQIQRSITFYKLIFVPLVSDAAGAAGMALRETSG